MAAIGPLLRYERFVPPNFWTGSVLVVTALPDDECSPSMEVTRADGVPTTSYGILLDTMGPHRFWKFPLRMALSDEEEVAGYKISLSEMCGGGAALLEGSFVLPSACRPWTWGCYSVDDGGQPNGTGPGSVWNDIMYVRETVPLHVLVCNGGVVTSSLLALLPELQARVAEGREALDEPLGEALQKSVLSALLNMYMAAMGGERRQLFASVPHLCGWGWAEMGLQGIPSHLFNTETVSFVRWAALRLYLLFLHHTTVEVVMYTPALLDKPMRNGTVPTLLVSEEAAGSGGENPGRRWSDIGTASRRADSGVVQSGPTEPGPERKATEDIPCVLPALQPCCLLSCRPVQLGPGHGVVTVDLDWLAVESGTGMANADTVASELALALRSLPTGVDHATVVLQGRSLGPWPSPAAQSTATGHRRASRASRASLSVHNAQHGAWPGSAAAEAATFVPPMAAGGEASGAAPDLEAARLQLRGRMMEVLVDVARHTQRRVTVVSSPGGGVATAEVRCPPATTSGRVRTSGATAGVASEVLMVHVATGSALPPPPPPDAAASPPPPRPAPPQQMPAVSSNETMATAATARVVPGTARDRGAPRGKGSQDIEGITENEEHRDAGTAGSQRKSASVDGAWAARRPSILSHIVSRFSGDASPIPTPVPLSGGLWEARMRPPHASAGVWAGWCLFHPGALPVHSPLAMHARKAAPTFVETGGPRKEARPAGNRAVKADAPPGCFLLRCFAKPRVAEAQPPLPGDPWAKLSQDLRPGSPRLPAEAETVPVGGLMAPAPGTEKGMGMGATRSRGRGPGDEKKIATGFGAFVRRSLNLPGPWNERQPAELPRVVLQAPKGAVVVEMRLMVPLDQARFPGHAETACVVVHPPGQAQPMGTAPSRTSRGLRRSSHNP